MDTQSELHRKALDQISHLLASRDAGRISSESLRIGIETIWVCLGGLVQSAEFEELMHDANLEVAGLDPTVQTRVFSNGTGIIVTMRTNEHVAVRTCGSAALALKDFSIDDEAIAYVGRVADSVATKGFTELTA